MSHGNPSGFHGMVFVVVKLADFLVKEVGYIVSVQHLYLVFIIRTKRATSIHIYQFYKESLAIQ